MSCLLKPPNLPCQPITWMKNNALNRGYTFKSVLQRATRIVLWACIIMVICMCAIGLLSIFDGRTTSASNGISLATVFIAIFLFGYEFLVAGPQLEETNERLKRIEEKLDKLSNKPFI
jgi:uncharacterized membrane protein